MLEKVTKPKTVTLVGDLRLYFANTLRDIAEESSLLDCEKHSLRLIAREYEKMEKELAELKKANAGKNS